MPHINKTKSIRLIDEMFSKAETRDMLKSMESLRPVHEPWMELVEGNEFEYSPPCTDRYTGPQGGADWGPSSEMLQLTRDGNLAMMFLNIFTTDTLKYIANRTKDYAYTDWVVPSGRLDRDGGTTKRPILQLVFPARGEALPENASYRYVTEVHSDSAFCVGLARLYNLCRCTFQW